jgi:hypothetical protein
MMHFPVMVRSGRLPDDVARLPELIRSWSGPILARFTPTRAA